MSFARATTCVRAPLLMFGKSSVLWAALVAAVGVMAVGQPAHARPTFTLVDNNSSIVVDASTTPTSRAAINSWIVGGVPELQELSNHYRVGSGGLESSVHLLPLISATQTAPNAASVLYSTPTFDLGIDFVVVGGPLGSGISHMGEQIRITNKTTAAMPFHFFEYVDLNLSNTPGDDTGQPVNSGFLRQFDSQTIATCGFLNYDRHEFSFFNSTLPHLMDGATSTLNNAPAFGNPFGPGDVTWALQWDFVGLSPPRPSIPAGGTATITKEIDLRPVPEPVGAVTAGILLVALIRGRRHVG